MEIGQRENMMPKAIKTYYENSDGLIIDNRPNHHLKPCEGKAVESDDVKVIRI